MSTQPYMSRRHFADLLHAMMSKDDRIWVLTADLGYMMWDQIAADFPNRFVNVGASEQLLVGAAVGLSIQGKIPICYTITPFFLRASEWFKNYVDKENINVKLVGAGLEDDYIHDGYSHHIFDIEKYMQPYKNINLFLPKKVPADLEFNFHRFVNDNRPGLMILRK